MLVLALDTTAKTASCAVLEKDADGERMRSISTVCGTLTHSETMLPMIEKMLGNIGKKTADIDLFAVSAGPGSFTGVRIGAAMVKGLAFGTGKPCVGVSTLEALAENLRVITENVPDSVVVPVMDARRGQVYTAVFGNEGRISEDSLVTLEELKIFLETPDFTGKKIFFVGDGYDLAKKFFGVDDRVSDTPALLVPQNAYSVARVALMTYENADDKSAFTDKTLHPVYLRASQAEREREEKSKQN